MMHQALGERKKAVAKIYGTSVVILIPSLLLFSCKITLY